MQTIDERDFRKLDLNLLVVFIALLRERNVTRAAQRLFVGQPALSASLKRLREAFGDPLFVRTSHGMTPTPRALALGAAITPFLAGVRDALKHSATFDAAGSDRVFHVGLSDSLEIALMPALMQRLGKAAPGVRLVAHASDRRTSGAQLDAGEIELAIGVIHDVAPWQRLQPLFDWSFVCLFDARALGVRARRITLGQYLKHPHVITSFSAGLSGIVDEELQRLGHERHVVYSSPHFATSPYLVRTLPAITTVPEYIAASWRDTHGLTLSPLPFELPSYSVSLAWASAHDADPGLQWLRGQIEALFAARRWT
ncbi:LysR family transcriptional regulator [Piscinibacter terrae]|uniref:LysR family transcriptional regulator n=1 Tax=Piscinibacter terrae TaxID=2496871 RepID=A0A3N7HM69_9BURK|nr:LysR family transcriptional regulator [Albitalea terrae]RQP23174.1 LysR family transcriptional regulator [Albitalea terrae]